jgi:hypothetical protein
MNKNIKSIFFVLTLITLLATVGAVSAADDSNSTSAVDNSVSDATLSDNNAVAAEQVTTSNDKQVDTKTIEKEDKNLKTATKTVEINNYNELTTTMNNAVNDAENDEYIINFNEGEYKLTGSVNYNIGNYAPKITLNVNNQTLLANGNSVIFFQNNVNNTINQANINHLIAVGRTNAANLTLKNVTMNKEIRIYSYGILVLSNTTITSKVTNQGTLIINDDTIFDSNAILTSTGTIIVNNTNIIYPAIDTFTGETNLSNITINKNIVNNGIMTLNNVIINKTITNNGKLIISDDTVFTDISKIEGDGEIEINDTGKIAPFLKEYGGNFTISNSLIDSQKTNYGNLTLINSTINSTIENYGVIYIDDYTIFGENARINGLGSIITNDITRLLPYIETISGNHTLTDIELNKKYYFNGNITLNNCNITSNDNENYGLLYINNNNIQVEEESTWIKNYGIMIMDEQSIITGNVDNYNYIFNSNLPDDYNYNPRCHVVTNDTILKYFDTTKANNLSILVKEGDTLDFHGTISGVTGLTSLVINKPINIITSTNDGRIENFSSITYNTDASGSNITGLYTYNTQFYVRNANNIVFDNISNVVNSARIGWGVGQTSIGHNSTNITVKNSYFYTKDNGGSSTFVFNWADNSTLINSTVEADGNVGNLVYLTTYNVNIPSGTTANCNNQILNNTLRGPETALGICWAIVLSGNNNTVDGNTIHYVGTGITGQWGSGITGEGIDDNATSLVNNSNHKIFNNKLYTGTGFTGITRCILVNNTFYNNSRFRIGDESLAINNTANNLEVMGINSIIRNNNITTNNTYTITGTGTNNTITDNYLKSHDKYADESVNLNKERNTIANNTPKIELIIDTTTFTAGQNTTIQAGIYFDGEIITDITKGKVTFKVDGKTLKDSSGKVIYAKIVNGIATIENYIVPDTWKEGSTIQAVYSGSTQCEKLTSEKENITINKEAPTLTIGPVEPATAGTTITLKATITDNNKVINTGKIVFKINGKTVKDENGKVIYAKVVNGEVSVEYTIPENYKAKDYTLTATYISSNYDRIEDTKTLTIN